MSCVVLVINYLRFFAMIAAIGLFAEIAYSQAPALAGEKPLGVSEITPPKTNALNIGLRVSSDFDDNAVTSQNRQQNLVTSIQPRLGWHYAHARIEWDTNYTPGVSKGQSSSSYDSFSHVLDSAIQVRLTKRLKFRFSESFLKSTNPFDQLRVSQSATTSVARNGLNGTASAASSDIQAEQMSFHMTYAVSAHANVGLVGELFTTKYNLQRGVLSSSLLQDSRGTGVHGYYSRQLSRHQWTGFDYHLQRLAFNRGELSSVVQSMIYVHTIAPSRPMKLSFFIGPERSVTEGVSSPGFSLRRSTWLWSGGTAATWSGMHTSVGGKFSRAVGDGGVLGVALVSRSTAELKRTFRQQWTATVSASHEKGRALAFPSALSYVSAAGELMRRFSPNLSLEFQYWRVHLLNTSSTTANFLDNHNRISMSLIYDFNVPLGR